MVLGKHNVRVKALAGRIASGLGHALVAPVVAYVPEGAVHPPTAHMRFPGTITIPDAAFESTLESAARSFREHGFRHVVLIGDHGGYQKSMKRVADKLNREWAGEATRVIASEDYYRASIDGVNRLMKDKGYTDAEIGIHAGAADTSLALAVDPHLVRADRLQAQTGADAGVTGNGARASADIGRQGLELIVGRTIESIRREIARR
jgi:creatinine amidohydrolase/Fe(II)-dependent formamide hydrolase-like protein